MIINEITTKIRKHTDGTFKMVIIAFIFCVALNSFFDLFEKIDRQIVKVRPTSDYYEYFYLEPEKPEFKIGEPIKIVSDGVFHEPIHIYWNEIIHCDFGEGFEWYDSQDTDKNHLEPRKRSRGAYSTGMSVDKEATCRLGSDMVGIENKYGIKKNFYMETGEFNIVK